MYNTNITQKITKKEIWHNLVSNQSQVLPLYMLFMHMTEINANLCGKSNKNLKCLHSI